MKLHPYHKYITNRDVNGYRDDMTLKDMVSQVGKTSGGTEGTPLMVAAYGEHFQVVKYLIEQGEADPNIADSGGWNALHWAADNNRTTTEFIQLLLTHMTLDSINKKDRFGRTPLDCAYKFNNSPIKQKIIDLIRSKGGKRAKEEEVKPSSEIINKEVVHELNEKYKKEFPKGTPLVCACEKGRFEDVKLLITGYNDENGRCLL